MFDMKHLYVHSFNKNPIVAINSVHHRM